MRNFTENQLLGTQLVSCVVLLVFSICTIYAAYGRMSGADSQYVDIANFTKIIAAAIGVTIGYFTITAMYESPS